MKRNLIAIAAVGLALGTNAAFADNSWAFDDAYWKSPAASGAMTSYTSGGDSATDAQFAKYKHVDGYNY
jgi:hypothetical protein